MDDLIRVEKRDELLTGLGLLIDPIRRLVVEPEDPTKMIPYIRSQFQTDLENFRQLVVDYCRPGKFRFEVELDKILRELNSFSEFLGEIVYQELREGAKIKFPRHVKMVHEAIRSVPCENIGTILPATSPLQTYFQIRSLTSVAGSQIDIFDPYLDADVFHRYLRQIQNGVSLRVITSEKIMVVSRPKEIRRRDEIVSVSELFAAERPQHYGLFVSKQQHDRHLRIDGTIYHLGGSMKDASKNDPFTISTLDPTQSNHLFLDSVIKSADEWFGSSVQQHKRS